MTLIREWIPSPNFSSRGGAGVRLIVLHTAEGARTIEDLGHFFQNSANQVSSHTGADDQPNKIGEYVKRPDKAWTCAEFNPVAIQLELCAFAAWSRDEWFSHRVMLENCAKWIAEEAAHFGIPITRLSPSQAQGSGRGVCQHRDLGARGGGHTDCGDGFPIDTVIEWARGGPPQPADHSQDEDDEGMQINFFMPTQPGNAPRAAVVIPNYFADGKARLRFGCVDDTTLRVDFKGHAPTGTVVLSEQEQSQGVSIPDGCKFVVVRRDSGAEPVHMVFSR